MAYIRSNAAAKEVTTNGIVTTNDGPLKLLGEGEITVALNCKAAAFTTGAKAKIEAAGGTCEVI